MSAAPPVSVPAVIEQGRLRLLSTLPFADGTSVVVTAAPAESASEEGGGNGDLPPLDPDDPLVRLLHLTGDGPPDGSTHIDEYKLGLKTWPPEDGAAGR